MVPSSEGQDAVLRSLREEVADLRSELRQVKALGGFASANHALDKLCTLYVRILEGEFRLARYRKGQILKSSLQADIDSGRKSGYFVDQWLHMNARVPGGKGK